MMKPTRLDFPTPDEIETASHEQLGRWYRFLLPETEAQQRIMDKVSAKFKKLGGMTPEISKRIGHGGI
jgi:hypothetical protein